MCGNVSKIKRQKEANRKHLSLTSFELSTSFYLLRFSPVRSFRLDTRGKRWKIDKLPNHNRHMFLLVLDDNFLDKMKTGVSNNNYSDKFQLIESISERNNNNSSPSIDLLSYSNISNNNVYVDIADLDETHSLMYSQNAQQWGRHDRTLSNSSSRKPFDDQSFYLANSTATSRSVHSSFGKQYFFIR